MDSLKDILTSHQPFQEDQAQLNKAKAILQEEKIEYQSLKIKNQALFIQVGSHIEATELRYRAPFLKDRFSESGVEVKKVVVSAKL
jgi:hypothetical protein